MDAAVEIRRDVVNADDELREALRQAVATSEQGDAFFGKFPFFEDLRTRNYSGCLNGGLELLAHCQKLDPESYEKIHKGTPYYWLGMAAFLVHDYQSAAFFFDAGVSEDLRRGVDPITRPTPGLHFIQIEGDQPDQAARQLVQETEAKVERAIAAYNARPGRPGGVPQLHLAEVRERFLRPAVSPGGARLRSLATTFISFFLEWDHRSRLLKIRVGGGTAEPFFLHLFKGCLLFESLLKANPRIPLPPETNTLGRVLEHLHIELGIPRRINIGGGIDLPTIIASLPTADDSIPTAVRYAGQLRNTVGHDLGWPAADAAAYDRLAAMVASSCLHAIACLYR